MKPAKWRTGSPKDWKPRTLRHKQTLFLACVSSLIRFAHGQGWELTPSDFAVDQERIRKALRQLFIDHGLHPATLSDLEFRSIVGHRLDGTHTLKLAADLNLFIKGRYQKTHCPEWDELGKYWKSLHSLCRWGGDFESKDYNHFSVTHGGKS